MLRYGCLYGWLSATIVLDIYFFQYDALQYIRKMCKNFYVFSNIFLQNLFAVVSLCSFVNHVFLTVQ